MTFIDESLTAPQKPVYVFHGDGQALPQPNSFRLCPLGIQIYNRREVPLYELMEFTMEIPMNGTEPEQFTCTCLVVNCQFEEESGLYRLWMKFLDMPESLCGKIHQITKTSKYLCPFCANF